MNKATKFILMLMLMIGLMPLNTEAKIHHKTMRGVWIATVFNLDYPQASTQNNVQAQKKEYINRLDMLQEVGINTIFVQVRPKADALYESTINPWSDILTGTQGKYPGYDPLAFMVEEAHKRGMSFHAWLNPYRVTTSGTNLNDLAPNHPARLHPEWVLAYNNRLYYDPANPEVKQHIADTVAEIVKNYDVDGIHFDDYFYPSHYPLPSGEHKDGPTANARRQHINDMVKKVSQTIDAIDSDVMFGISPIGIWKNKNSDASGSATTGGEGYYSVFADARAWIKNEWVDYIMPQIYWEIGHSSADYKTLVEWWSNEVSGTNVKLYIGQGIYKDTIAQTIKTQLDLNKHYGAIEGDVFFSLRDLVSNRQGVRQTLKTYFENEIREQQTIYRVGTVSVDQLNMRSGRGTHHSIIQKLSKGEKVKVIETYEDWYKIIASNDKVGYVSKAFIQVSDAIRLIIDGKQVQPAVDPFLSQGTTLVPLRIISEQLGASVEWKDEEKKVIITKGTAVLELVINQNTIKVNGEEVILALAPTVIQNITMVPIRVISEQLGANVDWDKTQKIITITNN